MVERCSNKYSEVVEKKNIGNQGHGLAYKIFKCIYFVWLLFMCMLPLQLGKTKILLMGILCISFFFELIAGKKKINVRFLLLSLIFAITYFIFLIYGIQNGYEFDFKLIEVFCLRPLVLFFLVGLVDDQKKFLLFMKAIIAITFIVIMYNLIYMLGNANIIPQIIFWEEGATIISDEFLAVRVSNQGSLMYLMPMCIMLMADIKNINFTFLTRTIIKMNVIIGTIVVMVSGRRTLQICTFLAFMCLFVFWIKKNKISAKTVVIYPIIGCFVVVVGLFVANEISKMIGISDLFGSVYSTIYDALNQGQYTGTVRQEQFDVLIKEWMRRPIVGWGLNAYVPYFTRSIETKWSYEYVYIAFLFQTGIIGVAILFTYILNVLKKLYKKYLSNKGNEFGIFFIANCVGFACFIIAGYTNPLVTSLWAWLIALVGINCNLESKNSNG